MHTCIYSYINWTSKYGTKRFTVLLGQLRHNLSWSLWLHITTVVCLVLCSSSLGTPCIYHEGRIQWLLSFSFFGYLNVGKYCNIRSLVSDIIAPCLLDSVGVGWGDNLWFVGLKNWNFLLQKASRRFYTMNSFIFLSVKILFTKRQAVSNSTSAKTTIVVY